MEPLSIYRVNRHVGRNCNINSYRLLDAGALHRKSLQVIAKVLHEKRS